MSIYPAAEICIRGRCVHTRAVAGARSVLKQIISAVGPLDLVRVSTARQGAVQYGYWDAVPYQIIRRESDGELTVRACGAARRTRRTRAGAVFDAEELSEARGIMCYPDLPLGQLAETTAAAILARLGALYPMRRPGDLARTLAALANAYRNAPDCAAR